MQTDPSKARILRRLPFEKYLEIEAVHFSKLKAIDTSPRHYAHRVQHERRDTAALVLGRVVHAMILDPEPPGVAVYEGKVRRGAEWTAFQEAHRGETILKRDELEGAAAMRAAVLAHPIAGDLFAEGDGEVTVTFSMLGLSCKARLDWLRPNGSWCELKTTRAIEPRAFARECARFLYHAQIAFYAGGLAAATGEEAPELPHLVTVEKDPPHDVAVYRVGYDSLEAGQRKIDDWIKRLDAARRSRSWPGVAPDILDLRLPEWTLTEGLADVDLSGIEGDSDHGSE